VHYLERKAPDDTWMLERDEPVTPAVADETQFGAVPTKVVTVFDRGDHAVVDFGAKRTPDWPRWKRTSRRQEAPMKEMTQVTGYNVPMIRPVDRGG
jgi:hypothetical protein